MQKTFYRISKRRINDIIKDRVGYNSTVTIIIFTIISSLALFCAIKGGISKEGLAGFFFFMFVNFTVMSFRFRYLFVTWNYFDYRVMDYVNIIDDDEFLFSYKMHKWKKEIFVRRNKVLQITFTNSVDDTHSFDKSGPTWEMSKKLELDGRCNFDARKLKLDLVKFRKPKHFGYYQEITEYIIPEFFEEQEELLEALHVLADNFEKRKYQEKIEQSPS